jgi:tetratricopeptide (TPR) repeat protein
VTHSAESEVAVRHSLIVAVSILALWPAASAALPAMSRAPETAACVNEPAPAPMCEAPERPPFLSAGEAPAHLPFDPNAPCPVDPPFLLPPPLARDSLTRCESFAMSQSLGSPGRAEALGRLALLQFLAGEVDEAEATLDDALASGPNNLTVLLSHVMMLQLRGDLPATRVELERLNALYPDDPRVRRVYSDLMAHIGTPEQALTAIEDALKIAPDDMTLHKRRADALAGLDRIDEAIAELDLVIAAMPNEGHSLFARARLELDSGDAAAAVADAERAKEAHFDFEEVDLLLAQANLMLGDLEAALRAVDQAAAKLDAQQGDTPMVSLYRFLILDRLGRSADAEKALAGLSKDGKQSVLRVQVYLRNRGFENVEISGAFDEVTKDRLITCLIRRACGGPLSELI